MCGITGFIDFKKESNIEILKKQCDTLAHRGPDGEGQVIIDEKDAQIGFGHRRLAIIDLTETGGQPMQYSGYSLTYNGEIYNHLEIKNELITRGHTFIGHSDTEMILHAFEEWGIVCLQKFIGMFAFVLFDHKNENIYCVRDRAGVKPFFYYDKNDLFLFGSELKSLIAHPKFEKQIDLNAVASFFQYSYVPTPHCIWQNTRKLEPGHYLMYSLKTKSKIIKQYWNVYDSYNKPKLKINFEDAKNETESILQKACNYRMVSDVPIGIFLSGGYDSTTVAALLQKDSNQKLKTFTIGVHDSKMDEAPFAKEIAKHIDTEHTEYYCTEKEALGLVEQLPFYFDEPFADSSAIPTMLVSALARKKVTVALSADAGDEVFAGYNRYDYVMKYGNILKKTPKLISKSISGLMNLVPLGKVPILRSKYEIGTRYEKIKNLLQNPTSLNLILGLSQQYSNNDISSFFINNIESLPTSFENKNLKDCFFDELSNMLAIDYQTYLIDDILQKVDRATMSVSLEGREPFLDHHVIEWAAQLPNEYKYFKGNKKYILKEINKKYIPESLMKRPKMGFGVPLAKWLNNELKPLVIEYCNYEQIKNQAIFNPDKVENLITDFFNGKSQNATKVWHFFNFQLWYEKWMK